MNEFNQEEERNNSRRGFLKKTAKGGLAALSVSSLAAASGFPQKEQEQPPTPGHAAPIKPDHVIRAVPENLVWGYFGADVPPVARIKDGDVAAIDTISTVGINQKDPLGFFKAQNLPLDAHAQEIIDALQKVPLEPSGIRGHMLTGPIYIEGAEPGDTLEVRIMDLPIRSTYGINAVRVGGGGIARRSQRRAKRLCTATIKRKVRPQRWKASTYHSARLWALWPCRRLPKKAG